MAMRSFDYESTLGYTEALARNITDAKQRLATAKFADLHVDTWSQCWPSSSCGFGGISTAVLTVSSVTIVRRGDVAACVYIAGKFAYYVEQPAPLFFQSFRQRAMLGASERLKLQHYGHKVVIAKAS